MLGNWPGRQWGQGKLCVACVLGSCISALSNMLNGNEDR